MIKCHKLLSFNIKSKNKLEKTNYSSYYKLYIIYFKNNNINKNIYLKITVLLINFKSFFHN